jgi:hypothetical protein
MINIKEIIDAVDHLHKTSLLALKSKNLEEYISVFDDSLSYRQFDNKIIDKNTLKNDQKSYFSRISSVENSYERLDFKYDNDIFSETLIQISAVSIRVFLFFKKKWTVKRKGIYKWSLKNNEWKIVEVHILYENIT